MNKKSLLNETLQKFNHLFKIRIETENLTNQLVDSKIKCKGIMPNR